MSGYSVSKHNSPRAPWGTAITLVLLLITICGCAELSSLLPTALPTEARATVPLASTPVEPADVEASSTPPRETARPTPTRQANGGPSATPLREAAKPTPTIRIATALPGERMATIQFDRLPPEARDVIRLIARGGPFPYRQDGQEFQNREGLLPSKPKGYYKEYTVITPSSPDRGARRIIGGQQGELYYTDDHYASFRRVIS